MAKKAKVESVSGSIFDIINSVDYHQNVLSGCDEILKTLNPEIAEKQKQEQENRQLREEINSLKEMFQEFLKQMK